MTSYTPTDTFDTVKTYDTSDPVLGGGAGESNEPIKELANRTQYIYNRLGGYRDIREVTGNASLTSADANTLIVVVAGANVALTIASIGTFKNGNRLVISAAMNTSTGPYWVTVTPADNISDGNTTLASILLTDGESIELVAVASRWVLVNPIGNFDKIGQDDLKRIKPRNSIVADGTGGLLRAKYPRLWAAVGSMSVADSTWSVTGYRYKGFFSSGNGTTTFRVPDMRGMYQRALDLGRGISIGRFDDIVGGYEPHGVESHNHITTGSPFKRFGAKADEVDGTQTPGATDNSNAQAEYRVGGMDTSKWADSAIKDYGTTETRTKNIGLIPVIYY